MRQIKITKQITVRENQSIEKYLAEINRIDLIRPEEEVILARLIREENDQEALDKLVKANLRFVVSVAKQFQNNGMHLSDLINEGNVGLLKAAQKFDETRGFKFISYAVWWIRQAIISSISSNTRPIRIPQNKINEQNKIRQFTQDFEQRSERIPTDEEISESLDISVSDIEVLRDNGKTLYSLDNPLPGAEESSLLDILDNGDTVMDDLMNKESFSEDIIETFRVLNTRERDVLKFYYGIGMSKQHNFEEIGEILLITRERARQIKNTAIRKLQRSSKTKMLKQYLG
jgi:RNA polymerase primary sigma factor